jgi:hypothetical protein
VRRSFLLLLLIIFSASSADAARERQVVLLAQRSYQADSLGFNLVENMSRYFYEWIKDEKIILWDSPEKKRKISYQELQGIETTTQTHFRAATSLFLYELWKFNRKEYRCNAKGYAIMGRSSGNEDVLYGYVEQTNGLKELLQKAYLSIGIQAPYGITAWQALNNRLFDADIVAYDGIPVLTVEESNKYKKLALKGKKNLNYQKIPESRLVEYSIMTGPGEASLLSAKIIDTIEKFFNDNSQEFYNYGGDKIYSFLKKPPVILSEIRVGELFTIKNNTLISSAVFITPYVIGLPMDPIQAEQFNTWEIKVDSLPFKELLSQRAYYYKIQAINGTNIPEEKEEAIRSILFNKEWAKFADKTL